MRKIYGLVASTLPEGGNNCGGVGWGAEASAGGGGEGRMLERTVSEGGEN